MPQAAKACSAEALPPLPCLMIQRLISSLRHIASLRSYTTGRHSPTVVVRMSNIRREGHGDGDAVSLSTISLLCIAGIGVAGIISISDAVLSDGRTSLATAPGRHHPAEQVIGQSLIASGKVQTLSAPPASRPAGAAVRRSRSGKQATHPLLVSATVHAFVLARAIARITASAVITHFTVVAGTGIPSVAAVAGTVHAASAAG